MSARGPITYEEFVEYLPVDLDKIVTFKVPKNLQQRATELSKRICGGKLNADEQIELQRFLAMEQVMRALKAKALSKKSIPLTRESPLRKPSTGETRHSSIPLKSTSEWARIIDSLPKDPDELLAYKFPETIQRRAKKLLLLNRSGRLTEKTREELDRMLELDAYLVGLKGRALHQKNRGT